MSLGEKAVAGLALRADAWLGGCMGTAGTVGPADLEVALVVVGGGRWQGF